MKFSTPFYSLEYLPQAMATSIEILSSLQKWKMQLPVLTLEMNGTSVSQQVSQGSLCNEYVGAFPALCDSFLRFQR